MAEKRKEKGECAMCATSMQAGTWLCADCGAMNVSKWKACWRCKSPRIASPDQEGSC